MTTRDVWLEMFHIFSLFHFTHHIILVLLLQAWDCFRPWSLGRFTALPYFNAILLNSKVFRLVQTRKFYEIVYIFVFRSLYEDFYDISG